MRLIRVLWALCLAWTIAIFPIAAPHAHAYGSQVRHAHLSKGQAAGKGEHAHHHVASDHQHASAVDSGADHHRKKSGGDPQTCCGTIACHAFLAGVTPALRVSRHSVKIASFTAETQAAGFSPGSLDRPPRRA